MKSRYSAKRIAEVAAKASLLGYEFINLSQRYDYVDRKYETYGLIDRRNNRLACAYSLLVDIEKFLQKRKVK
ncbi:MAG: hypothetical protein EAZ18_00275 [Oscillatoriales cyanobacterium]|nr:MAG: hypothetical protein EAZ18_00275 [Oscillatoriales cyanobacterium]